jgi:GNAT superfamily N-acetyltransferase
MTEFNIRTMTVDDLPAFEPLLEQLGYDLTAAEVACRFDAVVAAPGHVLEVAADQERLVGFIHYFARAALEKPPEVIVQALVVDAAQRGGGIGRRLMLRAETWAVDNGYPSVALGTQTHRDDAHAFYERLGYHVAATSHLMRKMIGGRSG